jgi:hypothetical protein
MDKIESRPEIPVIKRPAWLTRSAQGHLLIHWFCGQHWHANGWDALGDDGIRCAPPCVSDTGTVRLFVVGDATAAILRFIRKNRAPYWREGKRWPQRILKEERARLAPPALRQTTTAPHRQARQQPRRIRVATPIRPRHSCVPAWTWRAASEGIVQACLIDHATTPDKRALARLQRDAYRLLHRIERDPVAAWRQLVDTTGGDLDAGIAAAMR